MAQLLQIRDVPLEVQEALKARAASRGQSLNKYLVNLVTEEAVQPTLAEVLERAANRPNRVSGSSVEVLAELRREREHR